MSSLLATCCRYTYMYMLNIHAQFSNISCTFVLIADFDDEFVLVV